MLQVPRTDASTREAFGRPAAVDPGCGKIAERRVQSRMVGSELARGTVRPFLGFIEAIGFFRAFRPNGLGSERSHHRHFVAQGQYRPFGRTYPEVLCRSRKLSRADNIGSRRYAVDLEIGQSE